MDSDDDFMDLPGPSTRARVKRKEWPATDDPGGTSSNKVGGASSRKFTSQSSWRGIVRGTRPSREL